jgi:DNA-binding CsgD family transcriptional regulator
LWADVLVSAADAHDAVAEVVAVHRSWKLRARAPRLNDEDVYVRLPPACTSRSHGAEVLAARRLFVSTSSAESPARIGSEAMGMDVTALEAGAAIYRTSGDEHAWLTSVAAALRPLLDIDLGLLGYLYRIDGRTIGVERAHGVDLPPGLEPMELAESTMRQPAEVSSKVLAAISVSTASEVGPVCLYHLHVAAADYGVRDLHGLHVPFARGGYIFATLTPRERTLTPAVRRQFEVVRAHVAAGVAQRHRFGPLADAGLSPRERRVVELLADGLTRKEIAYALGIAAPTARVLLHRAARKIGAGDREALLHHIRRELGR